MVLAFIGYIVMYQIHVKYIGFLILVLSGYVKSHLVEDVANLDSHVLMAIKVPEKSYY